VRARLGWLFIIGLAGGSLVACNSPAPTPTAALAEQTPVAVATQQPTATPLPATSRPSPTQTTAPSATHTPSPTPTPTPAPALRQLTQGGCCTQPIFSPDSRQVLFIDKPSAEAPVGIYGVSLTGPVGDPRLINETIGFRSPDRTIVATIEGDLVRLTNETSGESWTVDTGANWPRFSPDGQRLSWVATDTEGPYDQRQSDVYVADLDGGNQRLLFSTFGGRSADWFPDSERLLLIGRDAPWEEEAILFTYHVDTGQRVNLFSHKQIRGGDLSPNGTWVAYFLTFAEEPADNGLWLINIAAGTRRKIEVPDFGGYRWRSDDSLLFIPFRASAEVSMQLWTIDAPTGQVTPLTTPATLSFSISNGDWDVSPDGQHIVFVNSVDQNIWLITLP